MGKIAGLIVLILFLWPSPARAYGFPVLPGEHQLMYDIGYDMGDMWNWVYQSHLHRYGCSRYYQVYPYGYYYNLYRPFISNRYWEVPRWKLKRRGYRNW
jgi:hypothetical protein